MSWMIPFAVAAALAADPACAADDVSPPAGSSAHASGALALTLNLPAFRVDVRDGAGVVRSYTVAIGSRRYRTPVGRYRVSSVELNPWWHPPDSEWARKEKVTPPGPDNPMGRAKLNFHELYFLHGTPQEASLGSAASHGCVRMASRDALELARVVLARGRPDVTAAEIDAAERDPRRTRRWVLDAPVPLEIAYRTAEVRDGALELHPDVYRRERTSLRARALDALRAAGVAADSVDTARLDSLVRAGRRGHVRLPLAELVRGAEPLPDVPVVAGTDRRAEAGPKGMGRKPGDAALRPVTGCRQARGVLRRSTRAGRPGAEFTLRGQRRSARPGTGADPVDEFVQTVYAASDRPEATLLASLQGLIVRDRDTPEFRSSLDLISPKAASAGPLDQTRSERCSESRRRSDDR